MYYQQISIKQEKLPFIKENHQEQITALEFFFQDAFPKQLPKDVIKFGGGTALSIYYFQHRLSFDIDLFLINQQYLSYFSPKHWIEDTNNFNSAQYIDAYNHIGVVSANNIKVDILVDSGSNSVLLDDTKTIFSFDIRVESIEDILAKKIVFRKKDNKARDIFDIAVALKKDNNIFNNLLKNKRVTEEDLNIFQTALESINIQKYKTAIEMIEPIDKYLSLANDAPDFLLKSLKKYI
jgi:predicted nucleotidyltransferase component of viral defense system